VIIILLPLLERCQSFCSQAFHPCLHPWSYTESLLHYLRNRVPGISCT